MLKRSILVLAAIAVLSMRGFAQQPTIAPGESLIVDGVPPIPASLADTAGTATPQLVNEVYNAVKDHVAGMELGVHLHSRAELSEEKIIAAYEAGCRRFDGALTGLGGCPFAGDDLVGNIATESILATLNKLGADAGIDKPQLSNPLKLINEIRVNYAPAPIPH